jgi:hypothetical protein
MSKMRSRYGGRGGDGKLLGASSWAEKGSPLKAVSASCPQEFKPVSPLLSSRADVEAYTKRVVKK